MLNRLASVPQAARCGAAPTLRARLRPAAAAVPLEQAADTGSRVGLSIRETPASVDILSQETMQARGDRTMVEAVAKVPRMTGGRVGVYHIAFSERGFIENGVAWPPA